MCIVCILWDRGSLTKKEAKAALWESTFVGNMTEEELEHAQKVYADIEELEDKEKENG